MLITFEGIDGCGKTTQIRLLKDYLESNGRKVVTLREPGGTDFSEKIRDLLLHSKDHISPRAELLLFESARAHLVETVIKPALADGAIVLCDRFYDSTTAYQGYGRGISLDEVDTCNMTATSGLKPNITFYLKLDLNESKQRSKHRKQDRIEQAGDDFFEKVVEGFGKIAEAEPERVVVVDARGNIESTSIKIKEYVDKLLNN